MDDFVEGLRQFGVHVDLLYLGSIKYPLAFLRARKKVIKLSKKYDLIHAQFGSISALVTISTECPKLVSLRGSDWYRYREHFNAVSIHSVASTQITRRILKRFDCIIVMSNRMRKEVLSQVATKGNVVVLPTPIDLTKFVPRERGEARAALGSSYDNDRWVLFTTENSSNPIKRMQLAKRAIEIVNQTNGNVKLRIATGIPHSDMPIFVASCDMALCISTHEGWPNSIKEALACNLPFVATDVSDLAAIAASESSCQICRPNEQDLAKSIIHTLASPRTNLRQYLTGMDMEASCKKLLSIYQRTLEEGT